MSKIDSVEYAEGKSAYNDGLQLFNNPYNFNTQEERAEDWSLGFIEERRWQERLRAEENYACEQMILP